MKTSVRPIEVKLLCSYYWKTRTVRRLYVYHALSIFARFVAPFPKPQTPQMAQSPPPPRSRLREMYRSSHGRVLYWYQQLHQLLTSTFILHFFRYRRNSPVDIIRQIRQNNIWQNNKSSRLGYSTRDSPLPPKLLGPQALYLAVGARDIFHVSLSGNAEPRPHYASPIYRRSDTYADPARSPDPSPSLTKTREGLLSPTTGVILRYIDSMTKFITIPDKRFVALKYYFSTRDVTRFSLGHLISNVGQKTTISAFSGYNPGPNIYSIALVRLRHDTGNHRDYCYGSYV